MTKTMMTRPEKKNELKVKTSLNVREGSVQRERISRDFKYYHVQETMETRHQQTTKQVRNVTGHRHIGYVTVHQFRPSADFSCRPHGLELTARLST